MNVKNAVLKRLEDHRGKYVSGESVAEELGVSRQAVSKAVAALKSDGYVIAALNNRGYMLDNGCDKISAAVIADKTGTKVYAYDSVPSTNAVAAKIYCESGECIVISNAQTAGKTKNGGKFYSPKDKGIYFSIALPLDLPLSSVDRLREICGNAAAEVIAATSGKNAITENLDEVFIDEKKVCGILTECAFNAATKRLTAAVVGIGIYTSETCFSDTTLASVFPDDTRNNMIADIYNMIKSQIKNIG